MRIFSYGTLVEQFPDNVVSEAILCGEYEIDEREMFPRLVKSNELNFIDGHILEFTEDDEIFEVDEYEGFPDLYGRKEIEVFNRKSLSFETVWVYF